MKKTTKRAALVALTLHGAQPIDCEECAASIYPGEGFYHDRRTDSVACSVACAGTLRARGNLRPSRLKAA